MQRKLRNLFRPRVLLKGFLALLIVAGVATDYTFAKSGNIYEEIQRFDKVLIKVDRNYVEEMKPNDLVDAAIEGMRNALDPHTAYFKKDDYDELMVHTKAEFGGLGITISIRDKVLTVVSPLPGTPASMMGIMAGDRIVKIDGKSTAGITVEQAVKKLRGKPGTQVTITVDREGQDEPVDYTITRAIIHIRSVPYSGMLNDSIGYIRLVNFSKESGREIQEALEELSTGKLSGLVLDLRNNPGGLLPAAIAVSEKLLGRDRMVVYTRGRMKGQNREYKTNSKPVLPEGVPLVVLVNEGSASASEIVAGAVQDWDRGVIMGRTTYGKGSVQTVLPLGLGKNSYLKMTTAYYYTPSGRCINKPGNAVGARRKKGEAEETDSTDADSLAADSSSEKEKEEYFTKGGRKVFGGGGIAPDIEIEPQRWKRLEEILERKTLFFKFVIKELAKLREDGVEVDAEFKVSRKMMKKFQKFVDKEDIEYTTNSGRGLEDLREAFLHEYGDSAGEYSAKEAVARKVGALFAQLDSVFVQEKTNDFERSSTYIRRALKRDLLASAMGEKARYSHILSYDPEVLKARDLLLDQKRIKDALASPKAK